MLNEEKVKSIYEKYSVKASKRFGQNFLISEETISKIIKSSDLANSHVVEIGPGLGFLTEELLKVSKAVTAYEVDNDMIRVLMGEIVNKNFNLIKMDFLKANFKWEGKRKIVANIPYNITSDILFTIFRNVNKFSSATLMIQKEVADRFLAKEGSKQYGKLAISVQTMANVNLITDVPSDLFFPKPKVDSAVVKLEFKSEYNGGFLEFVKKCFSFRRKTLFNNLKNFLPADNANNLIKAMGIKANVRPQELTVDQYQQMYEIFTKNE